MDETGIKLYEGSDGDSDVLKEASVPHGYELRPIRRSRFSLTIMSKLMISYLIVIGLFIALLAGIYMNYKQSVYDASSDRQKQLVLTAYSIIDYYYNEAEKGELFPEYAQKQAITTVRNLRYGDNDYFWITDTQPRMVMHPFAKDLYDVDLAGETDSQGQHIFKEFVEIAQKDGEGFLEYHWKKPGGDDPKPKRSYVKLHEGWGWIVGSGVYDEDVQTEIDKSIRNILIVVPVIAVIALILAYIIASRVTGGIRKLSTAAANVAGGDLTTEIEYSGNDELKELVSSFNVMTRNLRTLAQKIHAGVSLMRESSDQGLQASQEHATMLTQQSAALDQIKDTVMELSDTSKEIAGGADQIAMSSEETLKSAESGGDAVSETVRGVEEISEKTAETAEKILALGALSKEIGGVIDIIKDIADETKLIAFNAAIEATSAGDAGKRFSVVAVEVRNLAGNVMESTAEIKSIIDEILATSESSVKVTEEGVARVNKGMELAYNAGSTLEKIVEHMDETASAVKRISHSTQQQQIATEQVVNAVRELSDMTGASREDSHRGAEFAERLVELARSLERLTAEFKF